MANPNPTLKKKPKLSLVTFVWLLSLLLLIIRLIWVLPAAFEHHSNKKIGEAPVSNAAKQSKAVTESARHPSQSENT